MGRPVRALRAGRRRASDSLAASRPVSAPERLTPEPPFGSEPPAGCSGVAVTVDTFTLTAGNA